MTTETPRLEQDVSATRAKARLIPAQKRSRERFERILACAVEVMAEKGAEAFRMSDIVERTGIAFGSLYQYFPDKTAVTGTLADRHNALERECVLRELSDVKAEKDIRPALCRIVDGYYQMFIDHPVMRDIWQATQADRALQVLDEEQGAYLSGLLSDAIRRTIPEIAQPGVDSLSQLLMTLIAATVRHAIALPPREGAHMLSLFKQMLPQNISALEVEIPGARRAKRSPA